MAEENIVEFGLENVHYCLISSIDDEGNLTYEAPVKLPGAVELQLDPKGEKMVVKADNTDYYVANTNEGFSGKIVIVKATEKFQNDVLGIKINPDTGVATEKTIVNPKPFALMYQFEGDKQAIRHVLYNCSVGRPSEGSKTKEGTDVNKTELTIDVLPRKDKVVKRKTTSQTNSDIYENWFKAPYDEK